MSIHSQPPLPASVRLTPAIWLTLMVSLTAASGASCPQFLQQYKPATARVLPETASLSDVVAVVNGNSARVQSLYTTDATISIPFTPSLKASLALDRPRNFRLRAETALTGPEVDLGSNPERFWFWIRRNPQPAVYFCRHDQFQSSAARSVIPVEPEWLIDALGLTTLDPAAEHRGPFPVGRGRLQIQTPISSAQGLLTKVTVVDESRGWVLEQHLYDAQNQLLASALASQHAKDPLTEATIPARVEIQWPATRFSMRIDLRNVLINQLPPDPSQLWTQPAYDGAPPVDLSRMQLAPTAPGTSPQQSPAPPQALRPSTRF